MCDKQATPTFFPPKVWQLVKTVLGIQSDKDERPITSTSLQILTFSSALVKMVKESNLPKLVFSHSFIHHQPDLQWLQHLDCECKK